MTTETKEYGGAYFPKDKALKKSPDLKPLATMVKAATKTIAEAIIFGRLAAEKPEHIDDYFKVKIWEHREGLPSPEPDVFSNDFFDTVAVWNVNAGEPAATPQPETDEKEVWDDNKAQEELKIVSRLDQTSRAASLALFGPVTEITAAQYGQIVDLTNDDESSFNQNLAIAITKETRVLALAPERQEQLLAWVREKASDTAQWPDIKKLLAKWIDTPIEKREQATTTQRTESGATLGGGNPTDRSPDVAHNLQTLGIEVAMGILSLYDDIDIYAIPSRFLIPAKAMSEAAQDSRFTTWFDLLRSTPGILDYSRAAIIALIKSTPEALWLKPVELREQINRELVESDHANPDMKTINIACRAAPRNVPENLNEQTQQAHDDKAEIPAVCPARAAELDKELHDAFAHNQQPANDQPTIENLGGGVFSVDALMGEQPSNDDDKQELPPALSDRQITIMHALNDLISGRTNVMGKEEAEGVVGCTGHLVSDAIPLLMADIVTTEFCLSPDFSDVEIYDVATTMLDSWSDDISVRQKIALDAIVEYRRPELPKPVVLEPPAVTAKPRAATEPEPETNGQQTSLSYLQQLTIAALQGLCANPANSAISDEIPEMACLMARSIIAAEDAL